MTIIRNVLLLAIMYVQCGTLIAGEYSWQGTISFKTNYVFSTGVEIEDKPVMQSWLRATKPNGLYFDLWSNLSLAKGNPNRSAEIDFTIGRQFQIGEDAQFAASFSYYDIQDTELFDFQRDVYGLNLSYSRKGYYSELSTYYVQQSENGYRWANIFTRKLNDRWQISSALNFADGPYGRDKAAVARISVDYIGKLMLFDKVSFEMTDAWWKQDSADDRSFVTTVALVKNLF